MRQTSFSHPVIQYWTFQGGGSDVVSVACFGVGVLVMFHLMFVHYTFVRFVMFGPVASLKRGTVHRP